MHSILIADDSPINIQMLKSALKSEYKISEAADGVEALAIANQADKPDLILLDVMMPKLDGYEACKKLKESKDTADIPIIFITAKSKVSEEQYGLSLGAMDYISKPFNIPIVKARIKNLLLLKTQKDELIKQKKDLVNALEQIKVLQGFLPICCVCKKIRDDQGYWQQLEAYITDHSEAVFSHGLCPECMKKMYPEIAEKARKQSQSS